MLTEDKYRTMEYDHFRKGLKFNEGEDRRNYGEPVSSPEVLG
jgi:hypothetical protein